MKINIQDALGGCQGEYGLCIDKAVIYIRPRTSNVGHHFLLNCSLLVMTCYFEMLGVKKYYLVIIHVGLFDKRYRSLNYESHGR